MKDSDQIKQHVIALQRIFPDVGIRGDVCPSTASESCDIDVICVESCDKLRHYLRSWFIGIGYVCIEKTPYKEKFAIFYNTKLYIPSLPRMLASGKTLIH